MIFFLRGKKMCPKVGHRGTSSPPPLPPLFSHFFFPSQKQFHKKEPPIFLSPSPKGPSSHRRRHAQSWMSKALHFGFFSFPLSPPLSSTPRIQRFFPSNKANRKKDGKNGRRLGERREKKKIFLPLTFGMTEREAGGFKRLLLLKTDHLSPF